MVIDQIIRYKIVMKLKKFVSVIMCLAFVIPSLARAVSADGVAGICLTSGIAGYYASVSKAAFDMVNVVFEEFFTDISKNTEKKQQPAKAEENSKSDKVAIYAGQTMKTFKVSFAGVPAGFTDTERDVYVSKVTGDGTIMLCFWLILMMTMMILSIRKQDDYAVSSNICVNKHPVYL